MTKAGGNLTFFLSFFKNKRIGFTVYCRLEEKVQFYDYSISERAQNLSYNETKASGID